MISGETNAVTLMKRLLFLPFSPTWVIVDFLKEPLGRTRFLSLWRWVFLYLAIGTCVLLYCVPIKPIRPDFSARWDCWLAAYLWLVPFSRANELWRGFGSDAFARLRHEPSHTPPQAADRIKLLIRSYGEVVLDFGIIYFLLPRSWLRGDLHSIVDALYFSGTSITTVGFGDITPAHPISKLLVMLEVFDGIVLAIIALGSYLSAGNSETTK